MKLTIDNKTIEITGQLTLLEAAEQNGINIPKMCAHPELVPYGGCRLCIVEIEGVRGYPTSCTTKAEEGMVVRTNTNTLKEMRQELVQLILSEHPAACLLCEDTEGCSEFQGTIRKVGVTTGCRWCPKDMDCELQRIVDTFDIDELTLPGLYRDLPVEKYDPFFDRDYNLCIYCGRCVRICNEYRKSSVLSLRQRGKHTTIGPAFETNHTDADCEYCGACVSVCPTGAMSEKSRKWWGIPDRYLPSVCPLCSMNCELQTLTLRNRIVGTIPKGTPHETAGDLCVKGRFCLSELVNRSERILEPQFRYPEDRGIVDWKEAFTKGGEILKSIKPGRTAVFVSPELSLEEYGAVAKFSEKVLKSSEITSSCLDEGLLKFLELAERSVDLEAVRKADTILSLFFNGNYNWAPLTLAVKNLAASGTPYFQVGWIKDTTSRYALRNIFPEPGDELDILDELAGMKGKGVRSDSIISEIGSTLKGSNKGVIICGPGVLSLSNSEHLLGRIEEIAEKTGAGLFLPLPYGNIKGMLSVLKMKPVEDVRQKVKNGEIDLLYLIGDNPYEKRPRVKKVIWQNAFAAPDDLEPDLILPSSLWGESGGTWPGKNGSPVKTEAASAPHDYALSHPELFSGLSVAAGIKGIKFKTATAKGRLKPLLPGSNNKGRGRKEPGRSYGKKMPFFLVCEKSPHRYQGAEISNLIDGFNELVKTDHIVLNPADARRIGVERKDRVSVSGGGRELEYPVSLRKNIPKGVLYLLSSNGSKAFKTNPCYVNIRRAHV